ncbi:Zn(2)-C6 fungal-type DNA-binding domain [Phaffia rhodozyma]|uniref:Zn(2)-C6 fungal-type DNA-binding domain n=1 Tax=Phaffia rhodozyma TaxID=264483 RepID=A0A0F7SP38_PHARH|nr:Zn(2)-C6 fungal-type DNA-binding domain [Phaffia rhodozyma]
MSSEPSSSSSGNLRRGAACQRCSTGDKPSCGMCLKHSKECTYEDSYRPKTRLSKLEEKISRLENNLAYSEPSKAGQVRPPHLAQRQRFSTGFPYPGSNETRSENHTRPSNSVQQVKFNSRKACSPSLEEPKRLRSTLVMNESQPVGDQPLTPIQTSSNSMPECTVKTDFSPLEAHSQLLIEADQAEIRFDDWVYDFDPYADDSLSSTPNQAVVTELELSASLRIHTDQRSQPVISSQLPTPEESPSSLSPFAPLEDRAAALKVAVVDREELPKEVRNSLLSLFFLKKAMFAFSLNLDRFWSSLDQETCDDQPHPAFLFAMYHCASVFSPDVAVQALDDVFFDIAKRKLDEAFRDWDCRTIDLIRAAIILSFTSYARARPWFAWVFSGMAMRLCSFAHLQRISFPFSMTSIQNLGSDAYDQIKGPPGREYKRVKPPKDSIELGEYIHVFWMACTIDKVTSTSSGCAPTMHWSEIETPFPLPLELYANIDLVNSFPKTAVYDLFNDSQHVIVGNISASCHYIASLFLSEASRLRDEFIQPSVRNGYLSRRMSSSTNPLASPASIKNFFEDFLSESTVSHSMGCVPEEVIQLQNAVLRFIRSLPADRSNPTRRILGGVPSWKSDSTFNFESITGTMNELSGQTWGVDPETILIHTEIHTALALIFQERSKYEPDAWAQAVSSARSVVKILQIIVDVDFSQVCVIMATCWRIAARILSDEVRRHRSAERKEEPNCAMVDVDLLLLALERIGQVFVAEDECRTTSTHDVQS